MSSPDGVPGEGGGAPRRAWGLGDALVGGVVGLLLNQVLALAVWAAWAGGRLVHGHLPPLGHTGTLAVTAAGLVGLWLGLAGSVVVASRTKGSGSLSRDFGVSVRWIDVPVGLVIGVAGQLLLVDVVYLPWELANHHLSRELSRPARQLTGGYHGTELAILGVLIVVGAPVVEELFFRGLLLRSLAYRLRPASPPDRSVDPPVGADVARAHSRLAGGMRTVATVAADAVLFGISHLEPLQFLGLAAFGVVLAAVALRTGRIGPTIVAHAAFNAVTLIVIAR